jgi:hypothetical protein
MASSRMLQRVALTRTDVSEEFSASFISMTRIDDLGTTLAVTSNRRMIQKSLQLYETVRRHILTYVIFILAAVGTSFLIFW